MSFKGRTILITGATRGIGKAIALKLAKDGANIVIAAKSVEENPKLGGTIYTAAAEVEAAGGQALAIPCDIRFEEQVQSVIDKTVETFGGIDAVVNNASAISLTTTEMTETKRLDLMNSINVRGTFLVTKHSIPHLKRSPNAHILTLSPPLNLDPKWFEKHVAYTATKYTMSMFTIGWARELAKDRIAANALWPRTTIDTAAVRNLLGGQMLANMSRKPEILADAAYYILGRPSTECTGNLFIDEQVLSLAGIRDLDQYAVVPGGTLYNDLFV
jgi:NAD(P)-dependent dehydrogenase (short-subunit alcohol dehydrogenase family)